MGVGNERDDPDTLAGEKNRMRVFDHHRLDRPRRFLLLVHSQTMPLSFENHK